MKTTKRKREVADGSKPAAKARAAATPVRAAEAEKKPAAPVEAPRVALPGSCTVKDAAALKQTLCSVAQDSATVTIDVAALERIDTSAMQLLCAFVRDRAARNQQVAWNGTSDALVQAARLLGVSELLASGSGRAVDHPVDHPVDHMGAAA
jgi:ABC-type transporter Mla MlaB component